MQVTVTDRAGFAVPGKTRREYTDEGFLRVPGRVARTGTQDYLASELGLTDRPPDSIVRVHRPPEEVFKPESLDSYAGVDVTIEHPSGMVDSATYRKVSVGTVRGSGTQDGDFVEAELIVKDADAIKSVESGKVQLSAGYTAVYDEAPESEPYDFIQRDIRINHVALVDRARAGAQARLYDHNKTGGTMHTITLDSGRTVEVEDKSSAALITDTIDRLRQAVKDAEEKAAKAEAERDKTEDEMEEYKKKSSEDAINARVAALLTVRDDARKIAGKEFTCDSTDVTEIQRAALKIAKPGKDFSDKAPAYVQAMFDATIEIESEKEDEEDEKDSKDSQIAQLSKDAATAPVKLGDARQNYMDSLRNAHKGGQ